MLALVLRDVHVPATPSMWPPAPGWWLLASGLLLVLGVAGWLHRRRSQRLQGWQRLFDQALQAESHPGQVAAISELLRRAARRVDADADRLQGQDWLRFLDGDAGTDFSQGAGTLLLEGGYRRELEPGALDAVQVLARRRFLQLMAARKPAARA